MGTSHAPIVTIKATRTIRHLLDGENIQIVTVAFRSSQMTVKFFRCLEAGLESRKRRKLGECE